MPSVSKKQQQAMAMALAAKRGETPTSGLRGSSRSIAKSMTTEQIRDFAKTRRRGLPKRKQKKQFAKRKKHSPREKYANLLHNKGR